MLNAMQRPAIFVGANQFLIAATNAEWITVNGAKTFMTTGRAAKRTTIMSSKKDSYDAVVLDLLNIRQRLFDLGLIKTYHVMDKVTQSIGWEQAEIQEKRQKGQR